MKLAEIEWCEDWSTSWIVPGAYCHGKIGTTP